MKKSKKTNDVRLVLLILNNTIIQMNFSVTERPAIEKKYLNLNCSLQAF